MEDERAKDGGTNTAGARGAGEVGKETEAGAATGAGKPKT